MVSPGKAKGTSTAHGLSETLEGTTERDSPGGEVQDCGFSRVGTIYNVEWLLTI